MLDTIQGITTQDLIENGFVLEPYITFDVWIKKDKLTQICWVVTLWKTVPIWEVSIYYNEKVVTGKGSTILAAMNAAIELM